MDFCRTHYGISIGISYRIGSSITVLIQSLEGSLSHALYARLIPANGFGAVRLPLQPNRCSFVQSQAEAEDV